MLTSLPDVLVHLCLRGCPLSSRLRFARCSWRAYNACEDPFAFRGCELSLSLRNRYLRRGEDAPTPPLAPRLLRHVGLRVRWLLNEGLLGNPDSTGSARLTLPFSHLRLTALDASAYPAFGPVWLHLVEDSGSQLRSLRLHDRREPTLPTALMRALSELPKLSSLTMLCTATSADAYAMLADFPALTHLRLRDAAGGTLLPHVSRCAALRSLEIVDPKLSAPGSFLAFLSSAACASLTSLLIEQFTAGHRRARGMLSMKDQPTTAGLISEAEFSAAFAMLAPSLQTLELRDVVGVERMLPALSSVTGLRTLLLHCSLPLFPLSLLASTLAKNAGLRCVLILGTNDSSSGRAPSDADQTAIARSKLLAPWRGRVEVRRVTQR